MAQTLMPPVRGYRLERAGAITSPGGAYFTSAEEDRCVRASGIGTVMAVGRSIGGRVVAVLYPNSYNRATGKAENIVFRYFHLESVRVIPGDRVTPETMLGWYCGGGLHVEAHTDIDHPLYGGGTAATRRSPLEWLCWPVKRQDGKTA